MCPRCGVREKQDPTYCIPCRREYRREWSKQNHEHEQKLNREYFYKNRAEREVQIKLWRDKNRDRINRQSASWARQNRIRKNQTVIARARKLRNRSLGLLSATLTKAVEIKKQGYEVDHIIPIHGRDVSGLHVPWNLQALPVELNRRKAASFDNQTYQAWRVAGGAGPYIP